MAGKIRKLGWTALIAGGITELGRVVSDISNVRAYQIERLFNPETVSSFSYNFGINLWFVVAALILFFLSYVFRYGEALQQEADETL